MLAWLLTADGDVEEVDVDVDAVQLPDEYIVRLIDVLSGLVNDDQS